MPELTPIIILIGGFICASVGFLARGLFVPAEIRDAVDATWRKIENSQRKGHIEDLRNDTRLS